MVLVGLMIGAGFLCAIVVLVAYGIAIREGGQQRLQSRVDQSSVAGSILYSIAIAGGGSAERAAQAVREHGNTLVATSTEIDLSSWGEAYARNASDEDSRRLLESAVRVAMAGGREIPLAQYNALLELNFALGFHSDALARLRERHEFTYTDYAKAGRPRNADRSGGGAPLFVRVTDEGRAQRLSRMGLDSSSSRQDLVSRYRKLAAENHPDRFHGADSEEQTRASARFIELTADYEALLRSFRED